MKKIGYALFVISGLLLWYFQFRAFAHWWDLTGIIISIFVPPLTIFFPLIFWVKESYFPTSYFVIWGMGFLGIVLSEVKINVNWKILRKIFYIIVFIVPFLSKILNKEQIPLFYALLDGLINTTIWYVLLEGLIWIFKKIRTSKSLDPKKGL